MEIVGNVVKLQPFVTLTTAIIVLFVGKWLNGRFEVLRWFNISESVSGGLLVSIALAAFFFVFSVEIEFDLAARPFLIVYFFTAIGINTRLRDILSARRPLITLLMTMSAYMVLQDIIAVAMARGLGGIGAEALLAGTVALTGGDNAVIAWSSVFETEFGVANAREIGLATAAFGLILGSLAGGPIARYLTQKHRLQRETLDIADEGQSSEIAHRKVDHYDFLQSILVVHICIIIGFALDQFFANAGLALPLPAVCFFVAVALTNIVPTLLPKTGWPGRSMSMFFIAELSLGILFGMSMIGAQLWVIADLPLQHLTIVLVQVVAMVAVTILVIFRILGRNHDAAILCAGFAGFALGSASTAMANMKAVARHSGTSHMGFVILPLVAVICLDVVNRFLIPLFLDRF